MATSSTIGIRNEDNSITYIYCHWDGYPEHHGPLLLNHYNTTEAVRELIALGSLSSLEETIGEAHDFDKRPEGQCTAYHRDRGEALVISTAKTPDEYEPEQYNYVWEGDHWEMATGPWNAFGTPAADQFMSEAVTLTPKLWETAA